MNFQYLADNFMKMAVYSLFKITQNCNKYITVVLGVTLILNSKSLV